MNHRAKMTFLLCGVLCEGCGEIANVATPPGATDGSHQDGDIASDQDSTASDAPETGPTSATDAGDATDVNEAAEATEAAATEVRDDSGIADAPPDVAAPFDTGNVAPTDGSPTDGNGLESSAPVPAPASCRDVLMAQPGAASGRYTITVDATTLDVHCDMTLAGGGWTAFYVGQLGDVFAHFDVGASTASPVDVCPEPERRCLRHLPGTVTLSTHFAAMCGPAAVGFSIGLDLYGFFRFGVSNTWVQTTSPIQLAGTGNAAFAAWIYTGNGGGNRGWILSSNDQGGGLTANTFASAYDDYTPVHIWDFCNGVDYSNWDGGPPPNRPMVYLLYR